ncbi:hypothetical protein [Shewanella sp. UCD-KL12]|uniref:hypothetical protein n=1 Tax=Shewanella sp. UCD-KL12 TaxID=1917163 RepID=UPI00097079E2|nr:hypothetical protein [Shewanella sp. UCD-KL12]
MLDAICTFDKDNPITFTVFKFQSLSADEIEQFRQSLICPSCNGKAYFRKASKDGKVACFGSRYHQADCVEFKPSKAKAHEEQAIAELNQVLVDSDALMIDFSKAASVKRASLKSEQAGLTQLERVGDNKVQKSSKTSDTSEPLIGIESTLAESIPLDSPSGQGEPMSKMASQGLEAILYSLLRGSELAESDLWIYTDSKYRWRAKNLFVNFANATPTENGAPRMYWGTLSHSDKLMEWLNPSDCKDLGIPIADYKKSLFSQFDIQERRDLEGAGIILFGKCIWNKEKTRKIIQLWGKDINRILISKLEN